MTPFTRMVRAVSSMVALTVLLSGSALLVTPEPAAAQDCAVCLNMQGSFTCWGVPVGYAWCHLGPNSCRLEIECEEISSLQFREDGSAARMTTDAQRPSEDGWALDRTCDGVLLRGRAVDEFADRLPPQSTEGSRGHTRDTPQPIVI